MSNQKSKKPREYENTKHNNFQNICTYAYHVLLKTKDKEKTLKALRGKYSLFVEDSRDFLL